MLEPVARQSKTPAWKVLAPWLGVLALLFVHLLAVIIWHDYFYPETSDLSSINSAADVQATLDSKLILGQSGIDDTLALMDEYGVEYCRQKDEWTVICSTPRIIKILDFENRKIGYLGSLLMEDMYMITFSFDEEGLHSIFVRRGITVL